LTEEQAIFALKDFRPTKEMAEILGVGYSCIWELRAGRTWKDIQYLNPRHAAKKIPIAAAV